MEDNTIYLRVKVNEQVVDRIKEELGLETNQALMNELIKKYHFIKLMTSEDSTILRMIEKQIKLQSDFTEKKLKAIDDKLNIIYEVLTKKDYEDKS